MDSTASTTTLEEAGSDSRDGAGHLGIDVACWGDRWHLVLNGPLDPAGACALVDIVEVLATRRAPAVDLDLSGVTQIDEIGWRATRYAQSLLLAAGVDVRLTSPPAPLVHPAGATSGGVGDVGGVGR